MAFQSSRPRDAYFAIRGFVYQVERTIELWLELEPTDCLELECGEDVDLVANWVTASDDRLLEQIKRRESSITLNSPEARAALANFVEHRLSNPGLRLRFRFVTNARAGMESRPAMAKRQTGVEVWQRARQQGVARGTYIRAMAALRQLLRKGSRPTDTPIETWTKYETFLAQAKLPEMTTLVAEFEWSVGQQDLPELNRALANRLRTSGVAGDPAQARQVYEHLFVRVFHLLATKGTKRLTAQDLEAACAAARATPADARILARLGTALQGLQRQLEDAKRRLDGHDTAIAAMGSQVAHLHQSLGFSGAVARLGIPPSLSAPPPPATCALRKGGVGRVRASLNASAWVALHGMSGSGKTELARQVLADIDANSPWITLRDLDSASARTALFSSLLALGRVDPENAMSADWCEAIALELGGKVLVIDDLPPVQHDDEVARLLSRLATTFKKRNGLLLTTSAHALPARLRTALGELVTCVEMPPFSDEEALELFRAFGAEDTAELPNRARFVRAVTGGHAELLVTALVYLREASWRFSEEAVNALMGSNLTAPIRDDVLRRIDGTVPDSNARELLYRASVAIGTFTEDDAREIAACAPPVHRPRETLSRIMGLWIQSQGGQRFSVSPLLKGMDSDLAPGVRRCVHGKLGLRIMRQKTVGPVDVMCAITHFLSADEHDRAGVAYVLALSSLDAKVFPSHDAGLFSLWAGQALPHEMTRAIRIAIRSLQLGVHAASGKDYSFLAGDLFALAESVGDEDVSELAPTVSRVADLAVHDFGRTTTLIVRVAQAEVRGDLRTPEGKPFQLPRGVRFGAFFWHLTSFAGTPDTVRRWIEALNELGADFLRDNALGATYDYACVGLADRIWLQEASKTECEREWVSATALLDEVVRAGDHHDLSVLRAAGIRAQIIIRAEYQRELAAAEKLATEALAETSDATAQFLIREVLGRQYLIARRIEDAVRWLQSALACDSSQLDHARFIAELSLAKALSNEKPVDALDATLRALHLARAGAFPQTELVKALGEASIAAARTEGPGSAFPYLEEAASITLSAWHESDAWKDLAVLLAHTTGYFLSFAETAEPPPGLTADGEEFSEPQPGLFLTTNPNRAALCGPEHEVHIRTTMALFANAVHDDDRLEIWLDSVLDSPLWEAYPNHTAVLGLFRVVEFVVGGDCHRAILYANGFSDSPAPMLQATLGVSIHIAHAWLEDSEVATRTAREAAKAMTPNDLNAPFVELRTVAANLFSLAATPTVRIQTFAEVANQPGSHELVRHSAGVLATVFDDLDPDQALVLHVTLAMQISNSRMMNTHLHRRLYLPFLARYWQRFAARSAFLLRSPADVQRSLAGASSEPVDRRAQAILGAIVSGLGTSCPENVAKWFSDAGVDVQ